MPFQTTLRAAVFASSEFEVDGCTPDDWDDEHDLTVDLSSDCPPAVLKFDERQLVFISDEGRATATDYDGQEHEFVFLKLRPLTADDMVKE